MVIIKLVANKPESSYIVVHSQKRNKSVDTLQQFVTTSRHQDAFAWFAKAYWRQACCKLSTDLLQVDCQNLLSTGLLQVISTCYY